MSKLKIVNFDVPEDFLREFDDFIKSRGWSSRAEALRESMRRFMKEG
jgi:metal-responsive CopG/Arc/MetJ family transcriptional regulator